MLHYSLKWLPNKGLTFVIIRLYNDTDITKMIGVCWTFCWTLLAINYWNRLILLVYSASMVLLAIFRPIAVTGLYSPNAPNNAQWRQILSRDINIYFLTRNMIGQRKQRSLNGQISIEIRRCPIGLAFIKALVGVLLVVWCIRLEKCGFWTL